MVIVASKEIDGLKELEEKSEELKDIITNVFVAANGCANTNGLINNLMITYVAICNLEEALKNL